MWRATMSRSVFVFLASLAAAAPATAQVTRISVSTAGVEANGPSAAPSTSADGRYVVFASAATNLVAGDTNGVSDVFLRDRDTDADGVFDEAGAVATTRLSLGPGATQATGPSTQPAISADGRFVAFVSTAANLVAGANAASQVYRLDRTTGEILRVSESAAGAAGDQPSTEPSISANGDAIAFTSTATNLVADAGSALPHVFLREVTADRTARLSPLDASQRQYLRPSIAASGARVAYVVVPASASAPRSVFVGDAATGAVRASFETPIAAGTISASGARVIAGETRYVVDSRAASPPLNALVPPVASSTAAGSPSARYVLGGGGTLGDFDLGVSSSLGLVSLGASFSANDRWLAVASDTATLLPAGADTNGVADVFAVDLPARFDLDADTMDDRWEALFAVTSPTADPDADGVNNAAEENAGTHPNGLQKRYLAEGATGTFFATRLWLANPDSTSPARVVLNVDSGQGVRRTFPLSLAAGGSAAVDLGAISGFEASDASTIIESDRLVVVDRAMEWGIDPVPNGHGYGSHAETAAPAPSPQWFLAEGSTVLGFELFYLLQNPQPTITHTTVRYLLSSGTVITRTYDMAPRSRVTIYVNVIPGIEETDVSADISADAPIMAERAMYRTTPGQHFGLGTVSSGVTAPATRWFLAEGATGTFFDLYVLFANPSDSDALVTAEYARENGIVVTRSYLIRAHSRFSVYVDSIPGLEHTAVATTVTSTNNVPIVVERAMYWPGGFFDYYEGHTSVGTTSTAQRWVIARGDGEAATQTFVLLANTENRPGQAELRIMTPSGFNAGLQRVVNLPANSRTTVELTGMPATYGILVVSSGSSPVELVVESAVYRSYRGAFWAAGSNAVATALP
jgi:hypothetical protein